MARIATVFGATGKQGSSVVRALLADGTFTPRGVTRDVNFPAARRVAEQGCEVVQVDMWDKEAVERAVAGAEAVFARSPTIPFTALSELDQGISKINASKAAGRKPKSTDTSNLPAFPMRVSPRATSSRTFLQGKPDMVLPWTWIDRDMGPAVTALMKQYDARSPEIIGQTFVLAYVAQYAFSSEFEWYPGVEIPDPRLAKLGVEVGSIEEFACTTLKAYVQA
ncbi:NAD(P)-binding protein [Schizophyllum commune H4-8]|uniref:NmrA-like domain-containing protein n=1 Tax=Schizophyllum commune (strain H4-8 / FGSC 9210) TaxID=578458 RepID=D8PW46_SCHCM|nr:NAD(P)-binding protein [Schizophyllum commune H4-8]KAI5900094.1 NAD(P)-binding protein [Schizophyllum commune H4-8]